MSYHRDYSVEAPSSMNMKALRAAKKKFSTVWFEPTGHNGHIGTYSLLGDKRDVLAFQRAVMSYIARESKKVRPQEVAAAAPPRPRKYLEKPQSPPVGIGGKWVWVESPEDLMVAPVEEPPRSKAVVKDVRNIRSKRPYRGPIRTEPRHEHSEERPRRRKPAAKPKHKGHEHPGHEHQGYEHPGPRHEHSEERPRRRKPAAKPKHPGHEHPGHEHQGHEHQGHEHPGPRHEHTQKKYTSVSKRRPRNRTRVDPESRVSSYHSKGRTEVYVNPHPHGTKAAKRWRKDWGNGSDC